MKTTTRRVRLVMCLAAVCYSHSAFAVTLWVENAENGYGEVIDGTGPTYSLIQSSIVAEGGNAFHLANPSFQDNWFVIDETLTIQPDTKLFFMSRLGWATSSQVARVQISTNGGGSWPTNIYNQAGSGGAGEGAFALKELNLASYAGQNLRFRFYYDFTTGSAFTQTDPGVGWYVDNIQIGSAYEKTQWSIGDPSAYEQQYLEYVNRARADALVEAVRLRDEPDTDVQMAYDDFDIDGQDIVDQFNWYVTNGAMDRFAQPLSFQKDLLTMSQLHTQDMFDNEFQGHTSSSNPPAPFGPGYTLGQRLDAVGYTALAAAENVYSFSESVAHGHAGFDVDWGNSNNPAAPFYNPAFNGQGMQNPAGHRISIHNNDFQEVGIGVINGTNGTVGPQIVTQNFGDPGDIRYVTGVVYEDLNGNNFYDIGEGRSGVRVDVEGSAFYAISSTSGGYSVPVSADGTYPVTFSGGGYETFMTTVNILNGENEKIDYLVMLAAGVPGDYNDDGTVDAADYVVWRKSAGTTNDLPNDPTGGTIGSQQYTTWRANFGKAAGGGAGALPGSVPEPTGLWLCLAALFSTQCIGRRNR